MATTTREMMAQYYEQLATRIRSEDQSNDEYIASLTHYLLLTRAVEIDSEVALQNYTLGWFVREATRSKNENSAVAEE